MRFITLISVVMAHHTGKDGVITCAKCTGVMKNGVFIDGDRCFEDNENFWTRGKGFASNDTVLACYTETKNQVKPGFQQFEVKRDRSDYGLFADSTLKQSR